MTLDKAALDRWITKEPDDYDGYIICLDCNFKWHTALLHECPFCQAACLSASLAGELERLGLGTLEDHKAFQDSLQDALTENDDGRLAIAEASGKESFDVIGAWLMVNFLDRRTS